MMDSSLFEGVLVIVVGLLVVCWPITLITAAQRGNWGWFIAVFFIWFLAPLYFFQQAADRKKDARERAARQRRQERSRARAKEITGLKREVDELEERVK